MKKVDNLMTVQEVAISLKVTPQYVRKLISEGKLDASRIGKLWVVTPEQLAEYIKKYDVTIEPNDHERRSNDVPDIVALSFFSGAMGLDIGMKKGGIKALLACEFNKYCRMTIERNDPDIALIGDINQYSAEEILKLAKIPFDSREFLKFSNLQKFPRIERSMLFSVGLLAKHLAQPELDGHWMMNEEMYFCVTLIL